MKYLINSLLRNNNDPVVFIRDAEYYSLPYPYTIKPTDEGYDITIRRYPNDPMLEDGDEVRLKFMENDPLQHMVGVVTKSEYKNHLGVFKDESQRVNAFGSISLSVHFE